jgi:hypothetical protein
VQDSLQRPCHTLASLNEETIQLLLAIVENPPAEPFTIFLHFKNT